MNDKLIGFQQTFFADPKTKGIAALLIGVIIYSFVPILIRFSENELSPIAVIFHRFWIATVILGLWNRLQILKQNDFNWQFKNSQKLTKRTLGLLLGSGICFAITQVLYAWSLTQTSVANSSLLHSFTPVFSALGGWLIFTQNFDRKFIIGMMVTIIGSILLGFDDLLYDPEKIQGDTIALVSAVFFAIYFLLIEQIRNKFKVTTLVFYYCAIATLTVIPFLLINQEAILPSSLSGWLILIGLGFTLLSVYGLTTYALKWLSSALVSVILLIEPALSAIFAWVIFSEVLDFWNLLAFPIILLGVYITTMSQSAFKEPASI